MTDEPSAIPRLAGLGRSAELYPQKFDPVSENVLFVRMSEAAYRAASFLDDRILTPATEGFFTPYAQAERALAGVPEANPLHFIFHAGHVGSTLLSRLLDEVCDALPLREPLVLRTLADIRDTLGDASSLFAAEEFARMLDSFLRLWARGFRPGQAVVLKATSSTGRLAPLLLSTRPRAKAVYLNLAPETYLLTLLAGASVRLDLRGHAPERIKRLQSLLGEAPLLLSAASLGELAAMSWLAERAAQDKAEAAAPGRVLSIDFDALLRDVSATTARVCAHLELAARPEALNRLAASPTMTRYSKAPEHNYSPVLRLSLLGQARREQAEELRKGLAWLDKTAKRHPAAAALLAGA